MLSQTMKYITNTMSILSILLVASIALAGESKLILETDWLDTQVGSTGDVLGAKVVAVENNPDSDITTIEIKMPINNPEAFEDIEVIGKKTLKPIKQKGNAEWVENHEEGIYGLRLRLKKSHNFEFRIRLIDNEIN